jgi:hypothetical protein
MVTTKEKEIETRNFAAKLPFGDLNEPGTYLSNWSGHLIRVPGDGVVMGRSPVIEIIGKDPMFVTKLSDNPYIAVSKARMLAADLDLPVNF